MNAFATEAEVPKIPGHAINMALEKLYECVIDMAVQTIIDTWKVVTRSTTG